MMSKFKKMYREWFGLKEAAAPLPTPDVNTLEKAAVAAERLRAALTTEGELDEAQLVNNITDYQGGVQYILRDPAQAQQVAEDIKQWTAKKGFTTIKHTKSKTGKMGYFYFRLGQDPGTEAQKIQGYFSQLPELKHFRFNVVNQQPQLPAKRPQGKI
jgi:hypothetical protein